MKFSVSVLINTCYGGFSLSDNFLIEIFKIYCYDNEIFTIRPATDYDVKEHSGENVITVSGYGFKIRETNYGVVYNYTTNEIHTINEDVIRFHKGIHAIFLRLGGSEYCSGRCAELELVDVEYEVGVSSYDGLEELVVNKIR